MIMFVRLLVIKLIYEFSKSISMELNKEEVRKEIQTALDLVEALIHEEGKMDCDDPKYNLELIKKALIRAAQAL